MNSKSRPFNISDRVGMSIDDPIAQAMLQGGSPDEVDANIAGLVRTLNRFPGIETTSSCGGHSEPKAGQNPAGLFSVGFDVAWTREGKLSLEFLTWFINHDWRRSGGKVYLSVHSACPYLNVPGQCLSFWLEGTEDPNEVAEVLEQWVFEIYGP